MIDVDHIVHTIEQYLNHTIDMSKSFAQNGIDSLDTLTLLMVLEKVYGVEFLLEDVETYTKLGDAVAAVAFYQTQPQ